MESTKLAWYFASIVLVVLVILWLVYFKKESFELVNPIEIETIFGKEDPIYKRSQKYHKVQFGKTDF